MEYLIKILQKITKEKIELSNRAGAPIIKTVQRNRIKQEIEKAFETDLQNIFSSTDLIHIIGKTNEGIIIGLEHDQLVNNENTESEICIELNIKIKNLDYDVEYKINEYQKEQEIKLEEKRRKEEMKKMKKIRDEKRRTEKKALKELRKIKSEK